MNFLADLEFIAMNMREIDRPEIYGVRRDDNPLTLARDTYAALEFMGKGRIIYNGETPVAVIGVVEIWPGVWQGLAYGTEYFASVMTTATKCAIRELKPWLLERGAHRLEVLTRFDHVESHRWLEYLGAEREGVMRCFGRDGADFYRYAWTRDKDNVLHVNAETSETSSASE